MELDAPEQYDSRVELSSDEEGRVSEEVVSKEDMNNNDAVFTPWRLSTEEKRLFVKGEVETTVGNQKGYSYLNLAIYDSKGVKETKGFYRWVVIHKKTNRCVADYQSLEVAQAAVIWLQEKSDWGFANPDCLTPDQNKQGLSVKMQRGCTLEDLKKLG